jgi:L-fucose mutarotase/ribose pyranase (RbsD/FucU family)
MGHGDEIVIADGAAVSLEYSKFRQQIIALLLQCIGDIIFVIWFGTNQ